MTDCKEIYANGARTDGLYHVSPDGRCPFLVYCDMAHGGWTVIQVRGVIIFLEKLSYSFKICYDKNNVLLYCFNDDFFPSVGWTAVRIFTGHRRTTYKGSATLAASSGWVSTGYTA